MTPCSVVSHTALRALAGATAGLALPLWLGGCTVLPFLRPAPEPVVAVAAPVEPERPAWIAPAAESVPESDADGVARLVRFAEVWQTVRWFHPDVVGRAEAWDTAYLRHVDAARTASSDDAFIAAVHAMLGELGDVSTGVVTAADAGVGSSAGGDVLSALSNAGANALPTAVSGRATPFASALIAQTADSLVIARPIGFGTARERALQQRLYQSAMPQRVPRHVAVLDLRADSGGRGDQRWQVRAPDAREWPQPAGGASVAIRRAVVRDGRTALGGETECCARWSVRTERAVGPEGVGADSSTLGSTASLARTPARIAVIVNDASVIPAALLALHATGHALFVSTGSGVLRTDVATTHIPLVGGLLARVRTEELLLPDGSALPTRADTVVAHADPAPPTDGTLQRPDTADAGVQAALWLLRSADASDAMPPVALRERRPSRWSVAGAAQTGLATSESAPTGATNASTAPSAPAAPTNPIYPSHPERLLAVTQLWSAVRLFNPYLPMADESWDAMYREALGDAERASSSRTYAAALFRLAARTDASQVTLDVPDHPEFGRRTGQVPLRLRLVDRRALVTAIHDSAAERSGVQVGDEVVSIGGEPIDKRLGRLRDLMPASNSWARDQQLERWLESGPATVKSTYRVQRGTAAARDLEFAYLARDDSADSATRPTDALGADIRTARTIDSLSDGLWLVRLETHAPRTAGGDPPAPSALPDGLANAQGVIVDARGVASDIALRWLAGSVLDADGQSYVRDAVSELAGPPQGALRTPELDPARRFTWTARAAPSTPNAFTGPMVILVDATTHGDGELLALRLAAGGPSRIIMGTTTAGAVGDVRTIRLPGGVRVQFPVTDVRQPDGRFVQRLGVPPSIVVVPTVDGVRAGRDEPLEAARQWLRQRLAPPSRRR